MKDGHPRSQHTWRTGERMGRVTNIGGNKYRNDEFYFGKYFGQRGGLGLGLSQGGARSPPPHPPPPVVVVRVPPSFWSTDEAEIPLRQRPPPSVLFAGDVHLPKRRLSPLSISALQ